VAAELKGEWDEAALESLHPARAWVDLDRVDANYRALAAFSPVPLMPVVKADAYGHGATVLSRRLEALGAPLLAVGYPDEGVAVRDAGVSVPVVVMAGFSRGQVRLLLEHDLTPVVATPWAPAVLADAARAAGRPLAVHLKVDTGMSRLGFPLSEVAEVASRLADGGRVEVAGFMTHLASADGRPGETARQLDLFDEAIQQLGHRGIHPRWIHAANSAGLAFLRHTHTLARPGLLLYGLRPRPLCPEVAVRPVLSLSARVSLVKDVAEGTAVSYGGVWAASRPSRIATVPVGYADGVPRGGAMSAGGAFAVRGGRARVAGAVCMDLTMLDVTDHPDVEVGDEAVVFGDDPTAWEVADWAGTNAWDVLTGVGSRVPRVYVSGGRVVDVDSRYHGW